LPRKTLEALKWTLETSGAPTPLTKSSASPVTESVVAADFTKVSSIATRELIPTIDIITPVAERQSFLESNHRLHVLIVDDNDINLKVCKQIPLSTVSILCTFI
jgi:hypothetical protein